MGRPKIFTELDEAVNFFPPTSARMVRRLIERAARKQLAANRQALKTALGPFRGAQRLRPAAERWVARELSKALRQRGAGQQGAPSIKPKAPSGGRSFHFAHSAVSKASTQKASRRAPDPASRQSATAPDHARTKRAALGKAAAHMRYIERGGALERVAPARGHEDPAEERGAATLEHDAGPGRKADVSRAQSYIENPAKLPDPGIASFGTIGSDFNQRVRFWELLEVHERNADARVQDRLIVELPHEASPAARLEIVKKFCTMTFERLGLPYWAALHAPSEDNDHRNFHAHIVYSTRPAQLMVDPADGLTKWDFSIVEEYKSASRNRRLRHPYRQRRALEMEKADAIGKLRRTFANVVNEVMTRDGVKDEVGDPVRYDARSYWAMGLDVVPMRSVNRVVADKLKDGKLTVLDGDYTRKMIEAELRQARNRRDRKLTELHVLSEAIDGLVRQPQGKARGRDLPKTMRPSPRSKLDSKSVAAAGQNVLETRHAAYAHDLVETSARATITRIVEATDPKRLAESHRRIKDPVKRAALPDLAMAAALNAEAIEMRDSVDRRNAREKERLRLRVAQALHAWKRMISPAVPELSPSAKRRRELYLTDAGPTLHIQQTANIRQSPEAPGTEVLTTTEVSSSAETPQPDTAMPEQRIDAAGQREPSVGAFAHAAATPISYTVRARQDGTTAPDRSDASGDAQGLAPNRDQTLRREPTVRDPSYDRTLSTIAEVSQTGPIRPPVTESSRPDATPPAPAETAPASHADRPAAQALSAAPAAALTPAQEHRDPTSPSVTASRPPPTATQATPPADAPRAPRSDPGHAAGDTPPTQGTTAQNPNRRPAPVSRKATAEEKVALREIFEENAKRIMQAMRKLRSIPDVQDRMAAMEALSKAPLGPMDDKSKQILDEAWSRVPESRFAGRPLPTGNAPFPTARNDVGQDVVTPIVPAGGSGTGDGRMSATPTADPIGLAAGAATVRAGLTERERIGSGTPTALVEPVSPEATDNGATEPTIPEASHILTPEEELVAQRKAKAERDRKRRKALLSRGKGKGGRER